MGTPSVGNSNTATIFSPTFGSSPSTSDFKNFSVVVDGKIINLTPTPASATLKDLATDIQKKLQGIDGSTDLTVSVQGNDLLVASATSSRIVSSPSLSTSTIINLDNGAITGNSLNSTITGDSFIK